MPADNPAERPIKPEVRDHITNLIKDNQLIMFSKGWCPFCEKARFAIEQVLGEF